MIVRNPQRSKPMLKNGATLLSTECPRSLNALLLQLNQGDIIMAVIIKTAATIGARMPNNA